MCQPSQAVSPYCNALRKNRQSLPFNAMHRSRKALDKNCQHGLASQVSLLGAALAGLRTATFDPIGSVLRRPERVTDPRCHRWRDLQSLVDTDPPRRGHHACQRPVFQTETLPSDCGQNPYMTSYVGDPETSGGGKLCRFGGRSIAAQARPPLSRKHPSADTDPAFVIWYPRPISFR
jgi:hypothetical protein